MDHISQPEVGAVASRNPAELALELYKILFPYPSDVRQRAIQAAMASLGESVVPLRQAGGLPPGSTQGAEDFDDLKMGPKAVKWAQKHGVTRAMLDEVFHLTDDDKGITASSIPGASKRERTVNCYLLSGLRGLLKSDVPTLNNSDAIAVCKRLDAYDKNNHITYRKEVGNRMNGTTPTFTLTGPGEVAVAELVKQMTAPRVG